MKVRSLSFASLASKRVHTIRQAPISQKTYSFHDEREGRVYGSPTLTPHTEFPLDNNILAKISGIDGSAPIVKIGWALEFPSTPSLITPVSSKTRTATGKAEKDRVLLERGIGFQETVELLTKDVIQQINSRGVNVIPFAESLAMQLVTAPYEKVFLLSPPRFAEMVSESQTRNGFIRRYYMGCLW